MTVSSIAAAMAMLQQRQTTATQAKGSQDTAGADQATQNPAYQLSLSQEAASALLAYGRMGSEVKSASDALADIGGQLAAGLGRDGDGHVLGATHDVDVQQLAQAQVLSTNPEPDHDTTSLGTGTLVFQFGTEDPPGTFTPSADPVGVPITDGSLDGIAKAVNDAGIGVAATVVKDGDGQYRLEFQGPSGAAGAFSMSGIDALAHDPTAAFSAGLNVDQAAQDAVYSVDGGAVQTSASNTVSLAEGVSHTLTEVGSSTVTVPFGQDRALGAAETLVGTVDSLLSGNDASPVGEEVVKKLKETFPALAGIGITVAEDGSMVVDRAKLESAYLGDPEGTGSLLAAAADGARQVLNAGGSAIQSQLPSLIAQMTQGMSLLNYLDGSNGSGSTADPTAGLMSLINPSQGQAAASSYQSVSSMLGQVGAGLAAEG
ncbi:MAG: hypothetical protein ACM31L_02090 [Actinomycetota bacterium]